MNDGGPAFPIVETENRHSVYPGMSLRDYFAARAIGGLRGDHLFHSTPEKLAALCYDIADAMLAERAK